MKMFQNLNTSLVFDSPQNILTNSIWNRICVLHKVERLFTQCQLMDDSTSYVFVFCQCFYNFFRNNIGYKGSAAEKEK